MNWFWAGLMTVLLFNLVCLFAALLRAVIRGRKEASAAEAMRDAIKGAQEPQRSSSASSRR